MNIWTLRMLTEISPEYAGKIAGKIIKKQKGIYGLKRKSEQAHRIGRKFFDRSDMGGIKFHSTANDYRKTLNSKRENILLHGLTLSGVGGGLTAVAINRNRKKNGIKE